MKGITKLLPRYVADGMPDNFDGVSARLSLCLSLYELRVISTGRGRESLDLARAVISTGQWSQL